MEKHKRTRIIISGIAVIIWMIVIFIFSAMTGEESGNLSSGLVHALLKNIPFLAESELAHVVIRKLAHMTEYAILCLLIINLEKQIGFKIRLKHILIGIIISCIYAMTDEYHQSFVNERSGNIIDVGIDTLGAAIAGIIVLIVSRFENKEKDV